MMQPLLAANQSLTVSKCVKPIRGKQSLASELSNLNGSTQKRNAVPAGPRNGKIIEKAHQNLPREFSAYQRRCAIASRGLGIVDAAE
jgi:hypothetical protein